MFLRDFQFYFIMISLIYSRKLIIISFSLLKNNYLYFESSFPVSSNDLRKLKLNLDNMFNEKVRVEKGEKGKKSKGKGKARLRVEGSDLVSFLTFTQN